MIYKAAYFAGWNAEGILHGNDQPRDDYDLTDRDAQDVQANEDDDDDN